MSELDRAREADLIKAIFRLEKEQKIRYGKNELARYNTGERVHKKQVEFHKCDKRNRWVFGGNRTGKTECGAAEVAYLARGIHPYKANKPTEGWVVSLTREVQRDVAQKKLLKYLNPDWIAEVVMSSGKSAFPEGGVIDYIKVKNVFGSTSTIGFKSCEMGRSKFAGASLDYVWFDEEPPEDIYDECAMRVVDRKGHIFGTMTPLLGLTFCYERFYLNERNDPEVWCEFMEWADNPYLDAEEIARVSATMTEEEREVRRYGRFVGAEGLVYSEFDERVHVIEPFNVPPEWYDNISIDPGLRNPLSCHFYAVDFDGNVYVIAEHYEAMKDALYHCEKIKAIASRLGWQTDGQGRVRALIDSAATQHTLASAKSVSELFCDYGVLVNPNVNKDLYSGINRVKQYLSGAHAKLYIFKNCTNLIRELKSYRWSANDLPAKTDDHCLDELRYYLMTRPSAHEPKQKEKGAIALDKERLMRKLRRRKSIQN